LERRELLVKPSIQILFYTHVFLQWPFAVRPALIRSVLPFPTEAAILINGFVLIGVAISLLTWREHALEIFTRMTKTDIGYVKGAMPYVGALLALCTMAAAIHISAVPLTEFGLFVAMVDPELSAVAREESFKLIDSALVRYGFSLQTSTFAPMGAVFAYGLLEAAVRHRHIVRAFAWLAVLVAILLVVSLTGARMFAALIFFSIIVALILRRGFSINPMWALVGAAIVLLPAVLLTLLRQGLLGDLSLLPEYFWEFVGHRIFGLPLEVGVWYMHHEQVFGPFGITGIPRLADVFGLPAMNVPNYIGLMYTETPLLSISANGGYLFAYYAYFGMIALPLCLLGLWCLDFLLAILVRLDAQLLLPALAAMAAAGLSFVQSDFTVTLVSHGYGLIPVVALLMVTARRSLSNHIGLGKQSSSASLHGDQATSR
jgi:hypothetical protein